MAYKSPRCYINAKVILFDARFDDRHGELNDSNNIRDPFMQMVMQLYYFGVDLVVDGDSCKDYYADGNVLKKT